MAVYTNFMGYVHEQDDSARVVPCAVEALRDGVPVVTHLHAECGYTAVEQVRKRPEAYLWSEKE
jgi:hypothetical protein